MAKQQLVGTEPARYPFPNQLIPIREFYRLYLGCSVSKGNALRRSDPNFPKSVVLPAENSEKYPRHRIELWDGQDYIATLRKPVGKSPASFNPNGRPPKVAVR